MEKEEEKKVEDKKDSVDANEETEAIELVLFQVSECYVYLIPARKSAASYRLLQNLKVYDYCLLTIYSYAWADEWNVNKWTWEGTLKIVSKGDECIIKLEDKSTGELYARAFLRTGELHPVEPVIDSSRYFVLRIEEDIGDRLRHAFIGIGFRERTEAYDFQAALHDHMKSYFIYKYLDKKKTAEEMEQQFNSTSSVDYSLKEGQTIHLQLKNKSSGRVKSHFFEQGMNNLSMEDKGDRTESVISRKPLPPPPAPLSPATTVQKSPSTSPQKLSLQGAPEDESSDPIKGVSKEQHSPENQSSHEIPDDDFGDFQAAG